MSKVEGRVGIEDGKRKIVDRDGRQEVGDERVPEQGGRKEKRLDHGGLQVILMLVGCCQLVVGRGGISQ